MGQGSMRTRAKTAMMALALLLPGAPAQAARIVAGDVLLDASGVGSFAIPAIFPYDFGLRIQTDAPVTARVDTRYRVTTRDCDNFTCTIFTDTSVNQGFSRPAASNQSQFVAFASTYDRGLRPVSYYPDLVFVRAHDFENDLVFSGTPGSTIRFSGAAFALPEPGTWMLLLTGFAAIGSGLRRRRVAVSPRSSARACGTASTG